MKMLVALTLGVFTTFSTIMYITTIADFCTKASDKLCFDVDKNSIFTSENNRYYLYEIENKSSELLGNVSHVLFRLGSNLTESFHKINSTRPPQASASASSASPSPDEFFYLIQNLIRNSTKFDLTKDNNLKYLERRRNLQRVCRGYYNSSQILKVKKNKLDHILIDEKNKVLFCYVPKVACTNWKRVFMVLTGKTDNISHVINLPSYEIHAKNLFTSLQNYSAAKAEYVINNYSKFIFVRNPFERLLSAYRNKLEQHYDSSKYFQARFGKFIIKNFRKNPTNVSLEKGDDVTFAEFAKYLISSDVSSYNEHWQTVTELCHPCYVNYDLIGKYETLTEDSDFVLNYFKLNFSFPGLPKPSRTASSLVKYFSTLDKDVIYKLYKIYELDFKLFGYDLFNTLGWSGG